MKQQAIHYLGLDVHQATVVATSRSESGAIVSKATVPTEAKAIIGLVGGQGPRVHVAFEEGNRFHRTAQRSAAGTARATVAPTMLGAAVPVGWSRS